MIDFIIKSLRKAAKFLIYGVWFPAVYRIGCVRPIRSDRVLILIRDEKIGDNLKIISSKLQNEYSFDVHFHYLMEYSSSMINFIRLSTVMLWDMSVSGYVFLDDACNVPGRITLRQATTVTQLWHACGAFKKFGFSTGNLLFGASENDQHKYPYYKYCNYVTVSSPEVVWAYAEAMGVPEDRILPLGIARTDVFFDDSYIENARTRFLAEVPASAGKKVILYAPTFRGHVKNAKTAEALSIPDFYDAFSKDFVLVIKHHPAVKNPPVISEDFKNFAFDVSDRMSIEELLCVADLCISDYSSLIFEYSLFERPMIFFAYDLEEYFDWRGFYYDYEELTPGPVCKTNEEVIKYVHLLTQSFDPQEVISFREKFMSSCDGHSTERILKKVMGEDLDKYHL